jgi:hypothetical protein
MPRVTSPSSPRPSSFLSKPSSFVSSSPSPPVQTINVQRQSTTLLGAVKEGFGWGIGISVARNIFGGGTQQSPTEFERCIAEHKDDVSVCAHLAQKK